MKNIITINGVVVEYDHSPITVTDNCVTIGYDFNKPNNQQFLADVSAERQNHCSRWDLGLTAHLRQTYLANRCSPASLISQFQKGQQ